MDNICTACLCAGRNLYFIGETGHYHLYSQILNEIPVYDFSDICVRVCWECRAVLRRFGDFKMLVKRSYSELLQQLHHNDPPTKQYLIRPPSLQVHQLAAVSIPDVIKDEPLDGEGEWGRGEVPPSPVQHVKEEEELPSVKVDAKTSKKFTKEVKKVKAKVKKKKPTKKRKTQALDAESGELMLDADSDHCDNYTDDADYKAEETEVDVIKNSSDESATEKEVTKEGKKKIKKSKIKLKVKPKVKKKKPTKKQKTQAPDAESGGLMLDADSDHCDNFTDDADYKAEETEVDVIRNSAEESATEKEVKKKEQSPKKANGAKDPFPPPELVGDKPKCPECGKMFSSKKTYRYHLNTLHKGQNRYPCARCGKVYQWKSNLGRHMRSHQALDSGELYCALCSRGFASVATYRQHLRISRRHVKETDFMFSCSECGKRFVNKTRLRDHIDWDHLQKVKFRCQLCDKPFKCHTSLYVHMQNVHRNKKRENLCHICGKSYQNAAKLKYHIVAMHTSETPYACAECGAAFGWYSSLYRHTKEVHHKMKLQPKKVRKPKRTDFQADLHTHAPPAT